MELFAIDVGLSGLDGPRVLADCLENVEVIEILERCLVIATELNGRSTIGLKVKRNDSVIDQARVLQVVDNVFLANFRVTGVGTESEVATVMWRGEGLNV